MGQQQHSNLSSLGVGGSRPRARLRGVRGGVPRRQRSSLKLGMVQQSRSVEALHSNCHSIITLISTAWVWIVPCGILRQS